MSEEYTFDRQSADLIARTVRKVLLTADGIPQAVTQSQSGTPASIFRLTEAPTIKEDETEYTATACFLRYLDDAYSVPETDEQTLYFPLSSGNKVIATPLFDTDSIVSAIFRGRWEVVSPTPSSVRVAQFTSPMGDECNTGTAYLCRYDPEATPAGADDLCSKWVTTDTALTIYDPLSRCWAAGSRVIVAPALSTDTGDTTTNTAYWVVIEGIRKALVVSGTVYEDTTDSDTCQLTVDSLYWGYDPCGEDPLDVVFDENQTLIAGTRLWALYRPCSDSYCGLPPNKELHRYGKVGTGFVNYDGGDTPLHTITLTACDYSGVVADEEDTFVATIPLQPNKDTALFEDYILKCVLSDGAWVIDTYCWDDPLGTIKAVDLDAAIRDGWQELSSGQNRVLIGHGSETTDVGTQDGEALWADVIDPTIHGPIFNHTSTQPNLGLAAGTDLSVEHHITGEEVDGTFLHDAAIPMPPAYIVKWIRRFE